MQLEQYILNHISPEPPILAETYRYTNTHHLYPRMCSGHIQGRLLKMLTSMVRPQRVLEIGAFTGYSTMSIAEGLGEGAELHTIEIDDELTDELTERFARCPWGHRITLHTGDALELIPSVTTAPWDMVYIDANKRLYTEYFEMILPHVHRGGYIIADNTLWDGKVSDPAAKPDAQTLGIRRFNDLAGSDPRVETCMIPVRDGLTIMKKL